MLKFERVANISAANELGMERRTQKAIYFWNSVEQYGTSNDQITQIKNAGGNILLECCGKMRIRKWPNNKNKNAKGNGFQGHQEII